MRTRIIGLVTLFIVFILLILLLYNLYTLSNNKKLEKLAVDFTFELSKLFLDIDYKIDKFKLSDNSMIKLEFYKEFLLSKNDNYYVLPSNVMDESGAVAPPELDENGNIIEVTPIESLDKLKTDSNVYEEDGERRIKIKDLDFSNGKFALIDLDGGSYKILLSDVNPTYELIKNNIEYSDFYLVQVTRVEKNIYDVVLKSKLGEIVFKNRILFKGHTVDDFYAK